MDIFIQSQTLTDEKQLTSEKKLIDGCSLEVYFWERLLDKNIYVQFLF